ncbi:MAG: signal peptide peptidase SppA [Deltaproteobacteria bacterium]|nr:signal peptide peptidase SppA [Deltaproteobacteria bacterium]
MRGCLKFLGVLFAVAVGVALAAGAALWWAGRGTLPMGERVGVVEVRGFIADARPAVEALRAFRKDEDVKAVVVRVESPGGGIAPSQEIHDEVKRTAAVKPVIVSMGALAASGGYYLSAPATGIVALPGTATGSIGVILQFQEVHLLFNKLGLRTQVVKSGPLKDAGSPFREMTAEDRAVFQNLIDDLFQQFVDAVAEGRGMDRKAVLALADGRVYSGRQALDLGLVDRLGGFWDAVEWARQLAGLPEEPKLEYRRRDRRGVLRWLLGDDADALAPLEEAAAPPLRYALPGW